MSLSVLTLNIWHDSGDWPARRARIREWIQRLDPDLIGLQEVLRGDSLDQLDEILEGLGHHRDYGAAQDSWLGRPVCFGNAVASRWPIVEREPRALPHGDDAERRAALSVRVDAPVGPVSFTCTHLNWKFHHGPVRERQVAALAEQVLRLRPKDGFPPILVGDMNAEPDSDEIRFLTGLHSIDGRGVYLHDAWAVAGDRRDPGITWSNRNPHARANLEPDRRIDYVFAGYPKRDGIGLLEDCRVVCNDEKDGAWPSDHFGVFAVLRTDPVDGAVSWR